jgi:hypothetical protein
VSYTRAEPPIGTGSTDRQKKLWLQKSGKEAKEYEEVRRKFNFKTFR